MACVCESLKHSLCSPQNQFNFTFQEWSSVPAAEPPRSGGSERGERRGAWSSRRSVSGESEFGKRSNKKKKKRSRPQREREKGRASSDLVTTTTVNNWRERRKQLLQSMTQHFVILASPWEQQLNTQCVLVSTHTIHWWRMSNTPADIWDFISAAANVLDDY